MGELGGRPTDSPSDTYGNFVLVSASEGWMEGGPSDSAPYVTHDGGRSWRQVVLKAPREIYPATYPTYDLPTFLDRKRGFEAVTYSDPDPFREKAAVVLFRTADGGRTWKPDRMLTGLEPTPRVEGFESTMVGSNWLVFIPGRPRIRAAGRFPERPERPPRIVKIGPGEKVAASSEAASAPFSGTTPMIFATADRGWGLSSKGELMATADGGNTWTRIEPEVEFSREAYGLPALRVRPAAAAPPEAQAVPAGKVTLRPPQLYPDAEHLPPALRRRFMLPSPSAPSDQSPPPP